MYATGQNAIHPKTVSTREHIPLRITDFVKKKCEKYFARRRRGGGWGGCLTVHMLGGKVFKTISARNGRDADKC